MRLAGFGPRDFHARVSKAVLKAEQMDGESTQLPLPGGETKLNFSLHERGCFGVPPT